MTEYSERSRQLALELRDKALGNLPEAKRVKWIDKLTAAGQYGDAASSKRPRTTKPEGRDASSAGPHMAVEHRIEAFDDVTLVDGKVRLETKSLRGIDPGDVIAVVVDDTTEGNRVKLAGVFLPKMTRPVSPSSRKSIAAARERARAAREERDQG